MKKFTIIFLTILNFHVNVFAQTLTENEATPSVINETGAKLLITEVNFKNSGADWVEIHYTSPTNKPLNINGIAFADDSTFKKISQNITIQSGQRLLLYFKNSNSDQPPYFYTSRTGLTGTTEQFIIYDQNNKVLDAVCWASSNPTTAEMSDLSELSSAGGWNASSIENCLQSEKVDTDFSIARYENTDTNSANDWFIAENPTPGSQNIQISSTGTETSSSQQEQEASQEDLPEAPQEEQEEINQYINENDKDEVEDEIILEDIVPIEVPKSTTNSTAKKEAKSTGKKKSTSKKTQKPVYQNGDLSENIIISELLPNPEKDDNKNEWIELYNRGEEDINIGNWQLDDGENGSKPYIFSDQTVIKAGGTLLIMVTESKLSLANKEDAVRLFNYDGEIMDEINYEEAINGKSYALIIITREDESQDQQWEWVEPTPDLPNPNYHELTGEITGEPQFTENYSFEIKDQKNQIKTIIFEEAVIPAPLAKATFIKGSTIKVLLTENENDTYSLKQYEIINAPQREENSSYILVSIIASFIIIVGILMYIFRKKLPFYKVGNSEAKTLNKTSAN